MFYYYLSKLSALTAVASYESFVAIQKLKTDILNSYSNGELSNAEKRTLYTAANIICDRMRQELNSTKEDRLFYRSFQANFEWSEKSQVFIGWVKGYKDKDILSFVGASLTELVESFHALIDDYLFMREELWQKGQNE